MTTLQSVGLAGPAVVGPSGGGRRGRPGQGAHSHRGLEETEIVEFQKIVGSLIELVDQLAKAAETEKMKAIGARNLLKSIAKQREAQEQQLQALIAEKKMQLERYRVEYETLCKTEADQNEFIDQFIFQK
ncbi:PREDICTED: intraflagellar transport protein 20 homolog [Chaetura pelagica]|uniref:intraflagellar transport protein 20 homolog n=1 Tax=Chaetura pelagica TaxID=8897 RepID=UPI000523BD43|nr:PREDICTED: intraflagellar transport protein 20 homolog [Chaetura pelagica]